MSLSTAANFSGTASDNTSKEKASVMYCDACGDELIPGQTEYHCFFSFDYDCEKQICDKCFLFKVDKIEEEEEEEKDLDEENDHHIIASCAVCLKEAESDSCTFIYYENIEGYMIAFCKPCFVKVKLSKRK